MFSLLGRVVREIILLISGDGGNLGIALLPGSTAGELVESQMA